MTTRLAAAARRPTPRQLFPTISVAVLTTLILVSGTIYAVALAAMSHPTAEGPQFWADFGRYGTGIILYLGIPFALVMALVEVFVRSAGFTARERVKPQEHQRRHGTINKAS